MPITGYGMIRRDCPVCGCSKDKIEYWNCGPIVYIKCPCCKYSVREGVDTPYGKLLETWNETISKTN